MHINGTNPIAVSRSAIFPVLRAPSTPSENAGEAARPHSPGDAVEVSPPPLASSLPASAPAASGRVAPSLPASLLADPAMKTARASLDAAVTRSSRSLLHEADAHPHDLGHLASLPARPLHTADARAREAVISRMLARGPSRPDAALRERVREALSTVPLPVLRTVARAGVVVAVVRGRQTPLESGIIEPLRLPRDFPTAALRRHVGRALRAADDAHGADVAARRAALDAHDAAVGSDVPTPAQTMVRQRLARTLEKAERLHRICANHEMVTRSGGRLRPLRIPLEKGQPPKAVTVADVARLHGARTEHEERVFGHLMRAVNGDRLTRAQDAFDAAGGRSATERPFLSDTPLIVVPDLYFHRVGDAPDEAPVLLDEHDHQSQQQWSEGQVYGQFFPQARRPAVVLRDDQLGENEYGHSTPVHEVGHAYEWAVETLASEAFEPFARARDATWVRLLGEGESRFPSEYAQINPKEMVAESFAEAYGTRPSRLAALDARWSETFQAFLAHAETLGQEKPSWIARWLACVAPSHKHP